MSEKIEILITISISEDLIEEVAGVSEDISVTVRPAREGKEISPDDWQKAEVLYTLDSLPEPNQAPSLRWVQSYFAGVDQILDNPLFEREDLILTTMSGANTSQVAEHILTMLLALGHNLPKFFSLQQNQTWMEDKKDYVPTELRGSTVGIVGYGSVGRQVARLVKAFGADVLGTKRDLMKPADKGYRPEDMGDAEGDLFTRLYPPQALVSMVKECDYVVVCVPLTESTENMIGKTHLDAMQPTAYLVDVSRGGVVDQEALIGALDEGLLAGAALDVFPHEPLSPESPLWQMPNVLITPHIAGFSGQYSQRANQLFIENLKRYLEGKKLLNRVDFTRGY